MIHLSALPSSPKSSKSLDNLINLALKDLASLSNGGVDVVLVENFHDYPFYPSSADPLTIASMAIIVREIVNSATIPVGVNILRNACLEALAVATVADSNQWKL